MTRSCSRSRATSKYLGIICAALFVAVVGDDVVAAQKVPAAQAEELCSVDTALREAFPEGSRFEHADVAVAEEDRKTIAKRLGRAYSVEQFRLIRALNKKGDLVGFARVVEEIGKFHPITFLVATTPAAKVVSISVLVYRESHGGEVRRARFLRQFRGKGTRSALRLNRDVINISGATLSARAIARGVKRVVHTIEIATQAQAGLSSCKWSALPQEETKKKTEETASVRRVRYAMGTLLEIEVCGVGRWPEAAMAAAFQRVDELEKLLSHFRPTSDISRVNQCGFEEPVQVSADTLRCVEHALRAARDSGGAFDPTLQGGGYQHVVVDRLHSTIAFTRPGLRLDLGGIGKGYALDRAADVLRAHGVTSALLNFGGQILAVGPPPGADAWIVAVRDPAAPYDEFIGYYPLRSGSVATSGSYERGDHVIDPRSGGKPSAEAATCFAPTATLADAWSTIADVSGIAAIEEAPPGVGLLIVERQP